MEFPFILFPAPPCCPLLTWSQDFANDGERWEDTVQVLDPLENTCHNPLTVSWLCLSAWCCVFFFAGVSRLAGALLSPACSWAGQQGLGSFSFMNSKCRQLWQTVEQVMLYKRLHCCCLYWWLEHPWLLLTCTFMFMHCCLALNMESCSMS